MCECCVGADYSVGPASELGTHGVGKGGWNLDRTAGWSPVTSELCQ